MIVFKRTSNNQELAQIIDLQKQNLPVNLSDIEKKEQGFLTVQHNIDILTKMHLKHPHTIATHENKVIGYALSMSSTFRYDIQILKPMFIEIDNSLKSNEKFIIMGQICIDKNYRGKGIFRGLYNKMKDSFSHNYQSIITEIDSLNIRSLKAHKAIGFKNLTTYKSKEQLWEIVFMNINKVNQ
ncbi:GNAT family N-acetyltransferase [Tenacibaculum sp.]|nr:GNAT family N-acetyltransferase [Tenacibaculum sp.]